jgi:hypothetical protein
MSRWVHFGLWSCCLSSPSANFLSQGKFKTAEAERGPPFHLTEEVISENWEEFDILDSRVNFYPMVTYNWQPACFLLKAKTKPTF